MAMLGFRPCFGASPGPNSATPSGSHIGPGAHFLPRDLEGACHIVALLSDQLPSLIP